MANTSLVEGTVNLINYKTLEPVMVYKRNFEAICEIFKLSKTFGYAAEANFHIVQEGKSTFSECSVEDFVEALLYKKIENIPFKSSGRWTFQDTLEAETDDKRRLKNILTEKKWDLEFHYHEDEPIGDINDYFAYSVLNGPISYSKKQSINSFPKGEFDDEEYHPFYIATMLVEFDNYAIIKTLMKQYAIGYLYADLPSQAEESAFKEYLDILDASRIDKLLEGYVKKYETTDITFYDWTTDCERMFEEIELTHEFKEILLKWERRYTENHLLNN